MYLQGLRGRIIPALAGNTHLLVEFQHTINGSSPLSRGIPGRDETVLAAPRIIPALAGNTAFRTCRDERPRDHPRSRGEYCSTTELDEAAAGSSPLSRGIPKLKEGRRVRVGIIPALAGNTCVQRGSG